jgi:hypothetical protein
MDKFLHQHPNNTEKANAVLGSLFGEFVGDTDCVRYLSVAGWVNTYWIVHHKSHQVWHGQGKGMVCCPGWWGIWDGAPRTVTDPKDQMIKVESGIGAKVRLLNWIKENNFPFALDKL